ncbi:unnamed protein product [Periconia digitata]|uniref:Secreted protein n=1 Tax=Periconia digitata TaxID=1303443 RepID=A0A9W4UCT1_9PLEO|nr:unnamed protein product [Periconia digitata]
MLYTTLFAAAIWIGDVIALPHIHRDHELQTWTTCSHDDECYYVAEDSSGPPDLTPHDTRCNPSNASEVQAFDNEQWKHLFTCTFADACLDVDGHGACRLSRNSFELPTTNPGPLIDGEPDDALRISTKCNPRNDSEVLGWDGKKWSPSGVCLPPLVCNGFGSPTDFAFCARKSDQPPQVWLPVAVT